MEVAKVEAELAIKITIMKLLRWGSLWTTTFWCFLIAGRIG